MSTYSMHGGAGGIISIGMLRAVSLDYMEKCVKSLYSTGMATATTRDTIEPVLLTTAAIMYAESFGVVRTLSAWLLSGCMPYRVSATM